MVYLTCTELSEKETQAVILMRVTLCGVVLLSCVAGLLYWLYTYCCSKDGRRSCEFNFSDTADRLLFGILIITIFHSIVVISEVTRVYYTPEKNAFVTGCAIVGYFGLLADWMVLVIALVVSIHLLLILHQQRLERPGIPCCLDITYGCVIFGFPVFISLWPWFWDSYGISGTLCWIEIQDQNCSHIEPGFTMQFAIWHIEAILGTVFITISALIMLCLRTWRKTQPEHRCAFFGLLVFLCFYFIAQWIGFIHRGLHWGGVNLPSPVELALSILHMLNAPLWGAGVVIMVFSVSCCNHRYTTADHYDELDNSSIET